MGKQTRSAPKYSSSRSRSSGHHAANKSMKKGKNSAGDSYFNDDDELRNFQKQLEPMGLMIRDVQGDGNCLFRALGDQLDGHDRNHLKHRQDTVKYISEHRSDFEPFMEDGIPFDQHVSNMMQPGTHAGNDALVAFARLHKVVVIIHQLGLPPWQIEGTDEKGARQLHISYHNGEHYASVRRFGDTSEMPTSVQLTEYSASNDGGSSVCIEEVTDTVDSLEESSPPTESSTDGSDVGLWAPNGTGTRLFGDSQPKGADTGKKTSLTKKQQKALTKSQKKDLRRMERQQRRAASTSKGGTAAPSSGAEESTVVMSRDLSLLKI